MGALAATQHTRACLCARGQGRSCVPCQADGRTGEVVPRVAARCTPRAQRTAGTRGWRCRQGGVRGTRCDGGRVTRGQTSAPGLCAARGALPARVSAAVQGLLALTRGRVRQLSPRRARACFALHVSAGRTGVWARGSLCSVVRATPPRRLPGLAREQGRWRAGCAARCAGTGRSRAARQPVRGRARAEGCIIWGKAPGDTDRAALSVRTQCSAGAARAPLCQSHMCASLVAHARLSSYSCASLLLH